MNYTMGYFKRLLGEGHHQELTIEKNGCNYLIWYVENIDGEKQIAKREVNNIDRATRIFNKLITAMITSMYNFEDRKKILFEE